MTRRETESPQLHHCLSTLSMGRKMDSGRRDLSWGGAETGAMSTVMGVPDSHSRLELPAGAFPGPRGQHRCFRGVSIALGKLLFQT